MSRDKRSSAEDQSPFGRQRPDPSSAGDELAPRAERRPRTALRPTPVAPDKARAILASLAVAKRRAESESESEHSAENDYDELRINGRQHAEYRDCHERDGSTALVRTQAPRHIPNCLSDDSDSDKLQAVYQAATDRATQVRGDGSKAE